MNPWHVILTITAKDWRIEGRARDVLTATIFFAGLVVMILAFAFGPETTRLREAAPGVLWVAIAFASILAASAVVVPSPARVYLLGEVTLEHWFDADAGAAGCALNGGFVRR
jgi:hypothetical protein